MGAYLVICKGLTGDQAYHFFENVKPQFRPFVHALDIESTYDCTVFLHLIQILDCLRGLEYGIKLGWYDPNSFKLKETEYYEKVDNGDMNWIIPNKFLAFSSPNATKYDKHGYRTFTPEDYSPLFKQWKINLVVRLNNATYEREKFIKNNIKHLDLFFQDGTPPPDVKFMFNYIENFI